LKYNALGVFTAIIAFLSLVLPWWTLTMSLGDQTLDVVLYPWGVSGNLGQIFGSTTELWWTYVAMVLVVAGGVLGLIGTLLIEKSGKTLLAASGLVSMLSLIVFATGLISNLSHKFPGVVVFYFGRYYLGDVSAYLSFGFWLELTAGILSFVASARHSLGPSATPP